MSNKGFLKFLFVAAVLAGPAALTAAPVVDGVVDPVNEGWMEVATDCKDQAGTGVSLLVPVTVYKACDDTHAYVGVVSDHSLDPAATMSILGLIFNDPSIDLEQPLDLRCDGVPDTPGLAVRQGIQTMAPAGAGPVCAQSWYFNAFTQDQGFLCDPSLCAVGGCDVTAQTLQGDDVHFEMSWPRNTFFLDSGQPLELANWSYQATLEDAGGPLFNAGTRRCDDRLASEDPTFCQDPGGGGSYDPFFFDPVLGWDLLVADLKGPICDDGPEPVREGVLDIKPNNCPNTVPEQSDHIKTALVGFDGFDVDDVLRDSLFLEGVPAEKVRRRDEAGRFVPAPGEPEPAECACFAIGPDGTRDLSMEFDVMALYANSPELQNAQDGDVVALTLTGEILDANGVPEPFVATDCVLVSIPPKGDGGKGKGKDKGGDGGGGKGKGKNK